MFGFGKKKLEELNEKIEVIAEHITTKKNVKTLSSARQRLKKGKRMPRDVEEVYEWERLSGIPKEAWLDMPKYRNDIVIKN